MENISNKAKLGTVILEGQSCEKMAKVEGAIVTINQRSKGSDGNHAYFQVKINLENMSGDELMNHAAQNILITVLRTRAWKGMTGKELAAENGKTFDPMDYPSTGRVAMAPADAAKKAVGKMTQEELLELLNDIKSQLA